MNTGLEEKREWLRQRFGWQINVDALGEHDLRMLYTQKRLQAVFSAAKEAREDADKLAGSPVRPVTTMPPETRPYDPNMITVIYLGDD